MLFKKISHRIALQFTAFVFVLLIVNGAIFLAVDLGNAQRRSHQRLGGFAQTAIQRFLSQTETLPPDLPFPVRDRVRIVNSTGQTIFTGPMFPDIPFSPAEGLNRSVVAEEEYSVLTLAIRQGGQIRGYVQVVGHQPFPRADIPIRIILYLLVSVAISALVYVVGLFFARRSLAPAQQMLERLEQFTQDASHELRTPLASLNSSLDLALKSGKHEEGIRSAKEDVRTITGLVERLLELARLDAFTVERSTVDLSTLVQTVLAKHQDAAQQRTVTLEKAIAENVSVQGDAVLLRQVIENLVANAIKFSKPEGGTVTVQLSNEALVVRDEGVGIAPAELPHVFDRFYQADAARAKGGFGLGLALTKRIVELHGWTIDAESEEGKGTTFTVRFA